MKRKNIITLIVILVAGFLIYSITLVLLNIFMSPTAGFLSESEHMAMLEQRWAIRSFVETVQGISSTVFFIGMIVMTYRFIKSDETVAFKKTSLLYGGLNIGLFLCAGIFAMIDGEFSGDYFFPVWSILFYLVLDYIVVMISNFAKKRRFHSVAK